MTCRQIILVCIFFLSFQFLKAQEERITYDTTYQVTENNGVFDTVIYVHKHVEIIEHFFIMDSLYKKRWASDLYGGILTLSNTNSAFPESSFNAERKGSGFNIGGSVYYNFKSGLYLRGGVQLQHYKEKRSYSETYNEEVPFTQIIIDTLDEYHVENPDTTYYITETSILQGSEQVVHQLNYNIEHSYWHLNIPVQIGYSIHKKKMGIAFLTGVAFKFLLENKHTFNESDQPTISDQNITQQSGFQTSFLGSLQFHYSLGEKTLLQLEPQYELSLNENITSMYPSDILSVNFGLKYFF